MVVMDTNAAVKLVLDKNKALEEIAGEHILIAPEIMLVEFHNVMRKYHFLQGMSIEEISTYIFEIKELCQFHLDADVLEKAFEISMVLNHPIIDCLFLALAQQNDAIFVSFDKRLVAKAEKMGIKTMQV